ncbi:Carbamoyl-phosphate synthase small chain, partial [Bienertia sinuspersici]
MCIHIAETLTHVYYYDLHCKHRHQKKRLGINCENNVNVGDSLDIVLLDEQGSQIHALIKKDFIPHFKEVAKEGSVYTISHFGVGNNKKSHQQNQKDWSTYLSINSTFYHSSTWRSKTTRKTYLQIIGVENKINKTATSEERRTIHIINE